MGSTRLEARGLGGFSWKQITQRTEYVDSRRKRRGRRQVCSHNIWDAATRGTARGADRRRQTQTGPGRARQNQTAQARSDGPGGRRAIRPRQSQTGQTAQAGQTGFGHQAAQNQAHVPSCDNISVNENSVEFQASSKINQKSFAARDTSANRDAVVGPRTQIRTASRRERRFLAK